MQSDPKLDHSTTIDTAIGRSLGSGLDQVLQTALRPKVVKALLTAVVKRDFRAGDWLNAQKLAKGLGVSATPVREALVEMAAIGMVEMLHNRGTVVREFGPAQMRNIYHVRRTLEAEATRCACGRMSAETLKAFKAEMTALLEGQTDPGWSDRAMKSDRGLHLLIASHCDNQRLAEEISRYDALIQCIRDVVGNQSSAQMRALREHLNIINPLLKGRADAAASAMGRHIQSTADAVETALFNTGTTGEPPDGRGGG